MSRERRNLYRILHVQPEAPPEVIKAAWRALMSTLRAHPDLGGDTETAARLNAAYEVLSDPARRAAYDRSLRRTPRGPAAPPADSAPRATASPPPAPPPRAAAGSGGCPFCGHPHAPTLPRDARCSACDSPLTPLPARPRRGEAAGRRHDERFARDAVVELRLPAERLPRRARLRDLSFTGLQLWVETPLAVGRVLRVTTPQFDALVSVVGCRKQGVGHSVHGRLLTLSLAPAAKGVYVDAQA
ncbi:DnaJ domain-containing protein [Ideonella alba]|uniref:DnaJ domain-containing protein n=2 Tax=Ideonella TaxID=36862 RepID=A0A940YB96_9BURK|nr:DnaJ domain-containing protein [Ideonella alba]MBQ0932001.1 DnaJ domain-containing protein [Ideonella alba]